jgi:hypothetical protein
MTDGPVAETFVTGWGSRVLGLLVLGGSLGAAAWIGAEGGAPAWTWLALGLFAAASLAATVANFGDRWSVDERGLTYRNALTALVGLPRERHVGWDAVVRASEYEGRTWFLTVENGRRWVIDQLAEHDRLRLVLEQAGVSVSVLEKPKLFGHRARDLHRDAR